jgi:hypothetical protein
MRYIVHDTQYGIATSIEATSFEGAVKVYCHRNRKPPGIVEVVVEHRPTGMCKAFEASPEIVWTETLVNEWVIRK